VLVAGCEEGVGSEDYEGGLAQAESPAALLELICHTQQPRHDQWQIQCQAMAQGKARVLLHSRLSDEAARAAHLEPVHDVAKAVEDAVERARERGLPGSLLVMPHGQLTVPVIQRRAYSQG
jgi:nickel-dependent lactate racemase